ncbi:MAG: glutamate--tRNA ligase [Deltaproteobacteria bacterium]|jgi:glutamyl-tRNA synthetase|nr:glutamate--tRNA ligase [Deltaproteobacteria bacterium]MBW2532572.1 glutamate--tRNA ligase [Deltaproteobacteria bacterium]
MTHAAGAKPRLRFAPSPTGMLHIGGARTALFNWLWARKTGGTFVLRIEDTDRERSTPENEQVILRELRWLGLDWDEGPERGGQHGPYRQTERLGIYREFVDKLIAAKAAYRCYCTKEDLAAAREKWRAEHGKDEFRYPGTCRDRKDQPDRRHVIRLRAPSTGNVTYRDLVFGTVSTPNDALQDAVLLRPDGIPLYNFGCVVDDLTMGIDLVARGRDHMINTPMQILLYEALGHEPPTFAHLPMMLAPNGQKLSKRHGAVSVGEFRDGGILPEALLNYLARFGWSFGDEEVFSRSELLEKFDWERCGRADGKFDDKKLNAISFEHLKHPEWNPDSRYAELVEPFLERRGLAEVDRERLLASIAVVRERGQTLVDAADRLDFLFRDPPELEEKAVRKFLNPTKAELLPAFRELVAAQQSFTADDLEVAVKAWVDERGIKLGAVAQPARVALTGRTASPGLFDVMALLGRDRTLERLDRGVTMASEA